MKRSVAVTVLVLLIAFVVVIVFVRNGDDSSTVTQGARTQQTESAANTIIMGASGFSPRILTVKVGETVTFLNTDSEDHWPASDDHPTHQEYSEFDPARPILSGDSWSFTFQRPGTWNYHDHLFPTTRGIIVVQP